MRLLIAVSLVVSSLAFADVGPRPPFIYCDGTENCHACETGPKEDAGCAADALDAGLEKSDCYSGRQNSRYGAAYYCPPGTVVHERCGCSAVEAPIALLGLALFSVLKRRRRALP